MALGVLIDCINKTDRTNIHERIQMVGGPNPNGVGRWKLTEDEAIAGIKADKWNFFTDAGGTRAQVRIGRHLGREYLTTAPDGDPRNNLLALPECP
jgi:hypothetical protein